MIKIFAISGSLRRLSSNTALLQAASTLAPKDVQVILYEDLGNLPHFNPDLEGFEAIEVLDFRSKLQSADAILIASPEYAHGVTGVLKNAIDWVVGSGELVNKPVALLNASFRATHAHDSLIEILKTSNVHFIREASLVIALPNNKVDKAAILANPELVDLLQRCLHILASSVKKTNSVTK